MPSLASLTAHFSLPVWFKRCDTMDPKPWDILFQRILNQTTDNTLLLYLHAAEKLSNPKSFLEALVVVWMWQLKQELSPFHKVAVVETMDTSHRNKIRLFVLERIYHPDGRIDRSKVTEVRPTMSAFAH